MQRLRNSKGPERRARIDALRAQTSPAEFDVAAHILDCVIRGRYFDADRIKEEHPKALKLAYLHLGDD